MKFSIIIPCYNEKENITNLVKKIEPLQEKYDLEYVLVENGSLDNSSQYFKENIEGKYSNIQVVYVSVNRGYGYGIQQGLKVAKGDYIGWIHADMQMPPEELIQFFEFVLQLKSSERLFLKGRRTNRSIFDKFFTNGQSLFNTLLFGKCLYDVGAIPVLFSRQLLNTINIDDMPNDFSLEIYVYLQAIRELYTIHRFRVKLLDREKGKSSWNNGIESKIRQSRRIFNDSIMIRKGEKVL